MRIGVYIHIPFCSSLCHYCDFAKTARFSSDLITRYFHQLETDTRHWLSRLGSPSLTSIYFGGGTPGLFGQEYGPLLQLLRPHLEPEAEVTIETNPDNVRPERLELWRDLGCNRISIGIQTFSPSGLEFLRRDHSPQDAQNALRAASRYFDHVNGDLIYGRPGQALSEWQNDLQQLVDLGATHVSLYHLTYEPKTPIGRAYHRGRVTGCREDLSVAFYERACAFLGERGFIHEEVSNWGKPDSLCRHNCLYWQDKFYLGIGAGAHGYIPTTSPIGLRYQYSGQLKPFLENQPQRLKIEDERSLEDWLMEYIGAALRHRGGVDLRRLKEVGARRVQPTPLLEEGIRRGLVNVTPDRLTLAPQEWFREQSWALAVFDSLCPLAP